MDEPTRWQIFIDNIRWRVRAIIFRLRWYLDPLARTGRRIAAEVWQPDPLPADFRLCVFSEYAIFGTPLDEAFTWAIKEYEHWESMMAHVLKDEDNDRVMATFRFVDDVICPVCGEPNKGYGTALLDDDGNVVKGWHLHCLKCGAAWKHWSTEGGEITVQALEDDSA